MQILKRTSIAAAVWLIFGYPTLGQIGPTTAWQRSPASPGSWFTTANWSAGVPTSGVNALIDNGGTAQIMETSDTAFSRYVIVGKNSAGFLTQDSGSIRSSFFSIGGGVGVGRFTQTGGSVLVGGPSVGQPFFMGSTGMLVGEDFGAIYELSGGSLVLDPVSNAALEIGFGGAGLVRQSGGTVDVENVLVGSRDNDRASRYEMSSGSLQAGVILLGSSNYSGPGGEFIFSGGEITLESPEDAAVLVGQGLWKQTGGELTLETLQTNFRGGRSVGTIDIGGGAVTANSILVGDPFGFFGVHGLLTLTGPTSVTTDTLVVVNTVFGGSSAEFRIQDPAAMLTINQELRLGNDTRVAAVPGATVHMMGASFVNLNDNESQHLGLSNLRMIFEGGSAILSTFEVAGSDIGALPPGFVNNFDLSTLEIGGANIGRLQLVDQFDNQPAQVEALYVDHFAITAGSLLDLNGLNLYYKTASIDPNAIIVLNGGQLLQIPEPSRMSLLILGATMLIATRVFCHRTRYSF
jgi:hypothetical protein